MVKGRGQNSNRNTVKQKEGRKWPKNLGWRRRGRYYVTCAGCQEFKVAEWFWTWPGVLGLLWQVTYEVIPADHEHFESLAWPCMVARWNHWCHKRSHVPLFLCLAHRLPVRISTSNLHRWIQREKSIRSEIMILECSFPSMKRHVGAIRNQFNDWFSLTLMTFPSLASTTASSSWASFATTLFKSFFRLLDILPSTMAVEAAKDTKINLASTLNG